MSRYTALIFALMGMMLIGCALAEDACPSTEPALECARRTINHSVGSMFESMFGQLLRSENIFVVAFGVCYVTTVILMLLLIATCIMYVWIMAVCWCVCTAWGAIWAQLFAPRSMYRRFWARLSPVTNCLGDLHCTCDGICVCGPGHSGIKRD